MSTHDAIDKAYVSPYDKFLFEFDATHAKSLSQLKEIQKHARLAHQRDNKEYTEELVGIWEGF